MSRRSPSWLFVSLATAVLLLGAVTPARAQCPIGDLLDCGPCWQPAQVQLPQFPAFKTSALDICYQNCQNLPPITLLAEWGALRPAQTAVIPPVCSVFVSRLTLKDAAGAVQWGGAIRLWYSRTWIEEDGAGRRLQVWRFLANGDLKPSAGLAVPCPVPPCAAAFANKVHHWGYLDIAENCLNGGRNYAWALTHECDSIHHSPGFPRAGAFHPDRSYTFVGPAAGFVITPVMPHEGTAPIPVENFRPLNLALLPGSGAVCVFEERATGEIESIVQFCICGVAGSPPQYNLARLSALGVCGTLIDDTTQASGLISKGIGNWTNPNKYPGVELLRLNLGIYRYTDPCRPRNRDEFFFGVTTMQGYRAFASTCLEPGGAGPLPLTFIDQGNSLVFPGFTPTANFKYVSDIILNLNVSGAK